MKFCFSITSRRTIPRPNPGGAPEPAGLYGQPPGAGVSGDGQPLPCDRVAEGGRQPRAGPQDSG